MIHAAIARAPSAETIHRRKHARARLFIPARLVTFSSTTDCTLIDVSCSGARIGIKEVPRVGAMVVVDGCPIELFGTVCWVERGSFGFEFDQPFSEEQVIAMRHYADGQNERDRTARLAYAQSWVQGPAC